MSILACWLPTIFLVPLALRARRKWVGDAVTILLCLLALSAPFWVRGAGPTVCALVAIYSGVLVMKVYDLRARGAQGLSYRRAAAFLAYHPGLNSARMFLPLDGPRVSLVANRMAWLALHLATAAALLILGVRTGVAFANSFAHVVWLLLIDYSIASSINHAVVALCAGLGMRVDEAFRYPLLAHSVLDFWARYNVWIHQWLKTHVFERVGRRRPAVGILAAFAFSGILHEYIVDVVAPDLIGRQFAFFFLHGVAGVVESRLGRSYRKRVGRAAPRFVGLVVAWGVMLATGWLFTSCADRVLAGWWTTAARGLAFKRSP